MFELVLILIGFVGLWVGTEYAMTGAIRLTEHYGLSQGFVGLTVLAVGTDLPELLVGISGAIQGLRGIPSSGVIVGNAIGSAITQGSLVLGVAGLFAYLRLAPRMIRRDGATLLLSVWVFALIALNGGVDRTEGGMLLVVYGIYLVALIQAELNGGSDRNEGDDHSMIWTILRIFAGIGTVIVSAHVVVSSGVALAAEWNVDQTVVGVLLIGAGTSLPELALSIAAVLRGKTSMSVGNIIGSNIFDLLVPIGVSAIIFPVAVGLDTLTIDLPALAGITLLTMYFFLSKRGLQRPEAITLVAVYAVYATFRATTG